MVGWLTHFKVGWVDRRISLDTKEWRKIYTLCRSGTNSGRPARSQGPWHLSYLTQGGEVSGSNISNFWMRIGVLKVPSFFLSFFLCYLPSPIVGLTPPGLSSQMPLNKMPVEGLQFVNQNSRHIHKHGPLWIPESVVSTMSGPPPNTTQDRTQRTLTQPKDRN